MDRKPSKAVFANLKTIQQRNVCPRSFSKDPPVAGPTQKDCAPVPCTKDRARGLENRPVKDTKTTSTPNWANWCRSGFIGKRTAREMEGEGFVNPPKRFCTNSSSSFPAKPKCGASGLSDPKKEASAVTSTPRGAASWISSFNRAANDKDSREKRPQKVHAGPKPSVPVEGVRSRNKECCFDNSFDPHYSFSADIGECLTTEEVLAKLRAIRQSIRPDTQTETRARMKEWERHFYNRFDPHDPFPDDSDVEGECQRKRFSSN